MRLLRFLSILFLFTSCGAFVDYDYEKDTDFTQYKTYNYFTDMKSGFNQLDEKRLVRAIDDKLKAMGFEKSETPSFNIDIQSGEIDANSNSAVGVGIGGTGRNVGGGVSIGIPVGQNRVMREISIEFVDDSKNGVFWQAITTMSNIGNTPEKREESFMKLIEKVFSKYPPKK
ncbi:DUF4136 domain-containing protein [Winogradskyella haliclonae]|uniref:DUF4136 domain-containing protein n=1 Tax=Winogradskyella haliclonae TaxID=2048558 RepID=A0ABQ2C5F1_9FLAO|nr:DUF4136 domain-containing protein [Winogradskyella haliclonae]GGI58313.1 hypothetical protein GCM10011444_26220 [Winogradskyella haliclonae]